MWKNADYRHPFPSFFKRVSVTAPFLYNASRVTAALRAITVLHHNFFYLTAIFFRWSCILFCVIFLPMREATFSPFCQQSFSCSFTIFLDVNCNSAYSSSIRPPPPGLASWRPNWLKPLKYTASGSLLSELCTQCAVYTPLIIYVIASPLQSF